MISQIENTIENERNNFDNKVLEDLIKTKRAINKEKIIGIRWE